MEATFLREVFISSRKMGLSWRRLYRVNQTQLENQCPFSKLEYASEIFKSSRLLEELLDGYNLFSVFIILTSTFQFLCKFTWQKINHKLNKSALIYFLTKRLVKHRSQQYIVFLTSKIYLVIGKIISSVKIFPISRKIR